MLAPIPIRADVSAAAPGADLAAAAESCLAAEAGWSYGRIGY